MSEVKTVETTDTEKAEALIGKHLKELILQELKVLQDPWDKTPEKRQDEALARIDMAVKSMIRAAIIALAGKGYDAVSAVVDSVTFKDGVKTTLKTHLATEATHALADAQGESVVVVIADPDDFFGGMDEVKSDPDQPDMPLEDHEETASD